MKFCHVNNVSSYFCYKKKGWIKTEDSATFIRSEIAKARFANSQKLTLKSTNKYPGT